MVGLKLFFYENRSLWFLREQISMVLTRTDLYGFNKNRSLWFLREQNSTAAVFLYFVFLSYYFLKTWIWAVMGSSTRKNLGWSLFVLEASSGLLQVCVRIDFSRQSRVELFPLRGLSTWTPLVFPIMRWVVEEKSALVFIVGFVSPITLIMYSSSEHFQLIHSYNNTNPI